MTFVHTRTGATAAAPPQQQAWPHALRMQDAPWQAWSHACACRTLPGKLGRKHRQDAPCGKLGRMPLHAGRSLRHLAWSHAAACRTLPGCASPRQMQSMQDAPWGAGVGSYSATSGAHSSTVSDAAPSCQRSLRATAASARQPVIMYTSVQYAFVCSSAHGRSATNPCALLDARAPEHGCVHACMHAHAPVR